MKGLPSGTPDQIAFFDGVTAGQVSGYPGWSKPEVYWRRSVVVKDQVPPSRFNRFLGAGLVAWEPAWHRLGADRGTVYQLLPTDEGREWRQRIADREQRRAERWAKAGGAR